MWAYCNNKNALQKIGKSLDFLFLFDALCFRVPTSISFEFLWVASSFFHEIWTKSVMIFWISFLYEVQTKVHTLN